MHEAADYLKQTLQIRRHLHHHAENRCAECIPGMPCCRGFPMQQLFSRRHRQRRLCQSCCAATATATSSNRSSSKYRSSCSAQQHSNCIMCLAPSCRMHCPALPMRLPTAWTPNSITSPAALHLFPPMHGDYSTHSADVLGDASPLSAAVAGAGLHTAASCYWDDSTDGSRTGRWEN